ncbi:hypothetical protein EFB08_16590 [Rufibacter latericius]|uniref:Uncharacterized protein n=1 Tax=Rufibacter latericius TaxID=2487040 RepID=A0A3M9MG60_9BACT|nr:hypothetical protein EFB08_16590 [Rufibacter latericius]
MGEAAWFLGLEMFQGSFMEIGLKAKASRRGDLKFRKQQKSCYRALFVPSHFRPSLLKRSQNRKLNRKVQPGIGKIASDLLPDLLSCSARFFYN